MRTTKLFAVSLCAVALAACSKDTDGVDVVLEPLAGVRYVNLVPDTGALDFRIVDIVRYAPNQTSATFRTGGNPSGVTTTALPPHQPVLAGTRTIRVFKSHTHPDTASQVLLEANVTLDANNNYTLFLWGYSRTGSTPGLQLKVVKDSVPTLAANQIAVRVVHLAPTLAPTFASTAVDVWVDTLAAAATPAGTPTFANVTTDAVTAYAAFTARPVAGAVPALNYRTAMAAAASTTPFLQVDVPNGQAGTSTANPIGGDLVAGSAFTAVIVPPSVAGSTATSFTTPSIIYLADQRPPRTAP